MFCRSPVGTPPLESATVSREARAEIAHSIYAAVLAFSPEEFDRVANGPEGPFGVFEPHAHAPVGLAASNCANAVPYGRAPLNASHAASYWQIT